MLVTLKYQVINGFDNCPICGPVSLKTALKIYRIMIAPPYLEPYFISLYIRAVEVTV